MPAARSSVSVIPVPPAVMSNTLTTAVPWVPRYALSRPAMVSAAIRPSRFAGPASIDSVGSPVRK